MFNRLVQVCPVYATVFGTISNNARLQKYSVFKTVFCFEEYLNVLHPKHSNVMSKFRCSSHKLMIEQGRHLNVDRENRIFQNQRTQTG